MQIYLKVGATYRSFFIGIDCFFPQAFCAALMLDKGFECVQEFFKKHFVPRLEVETPNEIIYRYCPRLIFRLNFASLLQVRPRNT